MTLQQWMLLLFEDGIIHNESVQFALEFAKRMQYSILILMLAEYLVGDLVKFQEIESNLAQTGEIFKQEGIRIQSEIRRGDKASQFLKHMAVNSAPMAIVWGSDEKIETGKRRKKTDHWFSKVRSQIQCPIVAPRARKNPEKN